MANLNTDIYDKVIDRAAMIRLYERRVNGKVSVILDGHEVRVDKLIKDASLSQQGFETLREAVDQELLYTYKEVFNTSKRSLIDLFSDQVSFAYQNVESKIKDMWVPERPTRTLAEDVVLNNPLHSNKTLAAGWGGVSAGERLRLDAIIRKGIADNQTVNEIALAVRKNNVHNITRFQSKALVVTAITSVTAQADHAVYEANEKAIRGWQYVAVLDSRTTPVCAHRDGHIYPMSDKSHLPPAHFNCRSTTVPVFKSWEDIDKLEGVAQVRRANMRKMTPEQIAYYDGQTPMKESYNDWLMRQPKSVQLRHLGDYRKVDLFQNGELTVDKFVNPEGNTIGIKELRAMTDSGYSLPGDTKRFANAKLKLDAMQLGITSPEDLINNQSMQDVLADYYQLQSSELGGTLSMTNYRGALLSTKKAMRTKVLTSPPIDTQLRFNPITGRYEDIRMYQPNPGVHANNLRLLRESDVLLDKDKAFIETFDRKIADRMSLNERSVVMDNLRINFTRYRKNPEPWANFKAVSQGQIKFDVMNVSDAIETQIRRDTDILKKLLDSNYIDPVLGPTQLQELHDTFIDNIFAKNNWEDSVAPKIARELRNVFDYNLPPIVKKRLSESELQQFYLRFAHRLSLADTPDRDQFAVSLGRDLYNMANINGDRRTWYDAGMKILSSKNVEKFFEIETYGVQKRRMKSKMSSAYFGPYYDTMSYNIRVTDKRVQEYSQLTRKVELGLRVGVTTDKNRLVFREGFKTYFVDRGILGYSDTRIPITSTGSFSDFPTELIDKDMANALNWASQAKYRIDPEFHDFVKKLLYFEDDKGAAKHFNELNEYRKYMASRGDAYERLKSMEWLRGKNAAFSNHAFLDHRARIYDRGLISPQSGETFRPFLNTEVAKNFSKEDYLNFQDQVGSFLGGLSDKLEGRYNSLSITGRQKIAEKWRPELVKIGNHMLRGKPADMRAILENELVSDVDGEELGKFFRFAMETAKMDAHVKGNYKNLDLFDSYKTALALEQDASSSGAQIIALTTKNKQLAELSNVVPTTQKRRLYDEIASSTYNDPRFRKLNAKLGLTEKDLRKAAKAQNMVTFYGAGERTGILNVEGKLSKILGKDTATLVVKASDRDTVLNEISARIARYEKFDLDTAEELRQLRKSVKDIFNTGTTPSTDIMEQLYFLDSKTKDLVEKLTHSYGRVVTPEDFKEIASIMSSHLETQVPILKDFTKFFGRLAEAYLENSKPSSSDFDWKTITKLEIRGSKKKGYILPPRISEMLGLPANKPVSEQTLERFGLWKPNGTLDEIINGIDSPEARRTGGKYLKVEFKAPGVSFKKGSLGQDVTVSEIEIFKANKLPKSWTNIPWVNFDGRVIEQNFTQSFEEKLTYKDANGNWVTNILQIPQKTEASWWDQMVNKKGKINDIADATKARTAFAVNGNHSNDATLVKQFHMWGKTEKVPTSTIHDAFFANAADMLKARQALRKIYARSMDKNIILETLNEMRARGLPEAIYQKYLEEAIESGLIPVVGKSRIGGRLLRESDILKKEDILKEVPSGFKTDYGWYGVG